MSAKFGKLDSRTMLYILITLIIAIAIVYMVLNSGESKKVYTPKEILTNKNLFVNKEVTVDGIYRSTYNAVGMPTTDPNPVDPYLLSLDGSNIENFTSQVSDGTRYQFTGVLEWTSPLHVDVILVVEKFKIV